MDCLSFPSYDSLALLFLYNNSKIQKMNSQNNYDLLFKYIVVGDTNVGKSCLLSRYVDSHFKEDHEPTLGVEFASKIIELEAQIIKTQIWDTAGQESFKAVTRSYYKGSIAAFLVFDITSRPSFESLYKWLYEVKKFSLFQKNSTLIIYPMPLIQLLFTRNQKKQHQAYQEYVKIKETNERNNSYIFICYDQFAEGAIDLQNFKCGVIRKRIAERQTEALRLDNHLSVGTHQKIGLYAYGALIPSVPHYSLSFENSGNGGGYGDGDFLAIISACKLGPQILKRSLIVASEACAVGALLTNSFASQPFQQDNNERIRSSQSFTQHMLMFIEKETTPTVFAAFNKCVHHSSILSSDHFVGSDEDQARHRSLPDYSVRKRSDLVIQRTTRAGRDLVSFLGVKIGTYSLLMGLMIRAADHFLEAAFLGVDFLVLGVLASLTGFWLLTFRIFFWRDWVRDFSHLALSYSCRRFRKYSRRASFVCLELCSILALINKSCLLIFISSRMNHGRGWELSFE